MATPEKFQVAAEKCANRAENQHVSSTHPAHEYPRISAQELLIQLRTDRIEFHIVFLNKNRPKNPIFASKKKVNKTF